MNTDKSKDIFAVINKVLDSENQQEKNTEIQKIRDHYENLVQLKQDIHGGKSSKTFNRNKELMMVSKMIAESVDIKPKHPKDYHTYMTLKNNQKPIPYMRYDNKPLPTGKNKDINLFMNDVQDVYGQTVEVQDLFKLKKE